LRQWYGEGQEDQLGALGLVVNIIVLWNTLYINVFWSRSAARDTSSGPKMSRDYRRSSLGTTTTWGGMLTRFPILQRVANTHRQLR
jgi:hypothetical protein